MRHLRLGYVLCAGLAALLFGVADAWAQAPGGGVARSLARGGAGNVGSPAAMASGVYGGTRGRPRARGGGSRAYRGPSPSMMVGRVPPEVLSRGWQPQGPYATGHQSAFMHFSHYYPSFRRR
jgi:hypothetical protein